MAETFRTGQAEAFGPWPVIHRESGSAFALRPAVRLATAEDAQRVAELIATAFSGLRPMAYLVPDRRERHRIIAANFRIFVEHAVEHGEIHLIDDGPAVAVWFPYTSPLPAPHDYDRRLAEATGAWVERFRTLDELFERNHPAAPHHHLAFLAVHPDRQNEGSARPCCVTSTTGWAGCPRTWRPATRATATSTRGTATRRGSRSRCRTARCSGPCGGRAAICEASQI
ncbi:hypothetical protein ACFQQB_21725 [Nonomuraea rubra]|uniref:hypothetical protein n=1 Tax=Nonomuraea rubra TaxID=46180 RepID=UPI003617EFEC